MHELNSFLGKPEISTISTIMTFSLFSSVSSGECRDNTSNNSLLIPTKLFKIPDYRSFYYLAIYFKVLAVILKFLINNLSYYLRLCVVLFLPLCSTVIRFEEMSSNLVSDSRSA